MFPLFVKSLDMQNNEHANTILEYVNTACKYANIAPGYDSLGGIYKSEHIRPNTQLSYNLNCLFSRAKPISTNSSVAASDSGMQKYTSNSSSTPIERKGCRRNCACKYECFPCSEHTVN